MLAALSQGCRRNYSAPIGSKAAGAAFKDTWTLDDVDLGSKCLSRYVQIHVEPDAVPSNNGAADA